MSIPEINNKWINQVACPSFYATYYLNMYEASKELGYNLILHGSLQRDMDLIAIPWVESAVAIEELIYKLCEVTGTFCDMQVTNKPHGRKSYVLLWWRWDGGTNYGEIPYIDLSILSRSN